MSFRIFRADGFFARQVKFQLQNKVLETPVYFPAVSSYGTEKAMNYVKFLMRINHHYMLISAYDFFHTFESQPSLVAKINDYPNKGNFLLVDSGGYERKWNNDEDWDFDIYKKTIEKINADIYASLDLMEPKVSRKISFDRIKKSNEVKPTSQYIPIFDGTTSKSLIENIETFFKSYPNFFLKFLAIRERDCGVTITEKASTIFNIRKIIDKIKGDHILHVLGCGHPINIALYSFYGADSFDSADWYRKTLDTQNLILREFAHLQLLNCNCSSCTVSEKQKLDPYSKTLAHNLSGYLEFMKKIQELIRKNQLENFLLSNGIPKEIMKKIQS